MFNNLISGFQFSCPGRVGFRGGEAYKRRYASPASWLGF